MEEIVLIEPKIEYSESIMAFRNEMLETNDDFAGCGSLRDCDNCKTWLDSILMLSNEDTCPNGYVPSDSFLAVRKNDNKLIGIIELRHRINTPILSTWGGNIGFSVRPSERGKGYAKEMLRQLLILCSELGIKRVLVTCNQENIASEKTIVANGGVLDHTICVDGKNIKRYWISL